MSLVEPQVALLIAGAVLILLGATTWALAGQATFEVREPRVPQNAKQTAPAQSRGLLPVSRLAPPVPRAAPPVLTHTRPHGVVYLPDGSVQNDEKP